MTPIEHQPIETLQSALAYLMTQYSNIVSLKLPLCPACCALTIVEHLETLLNHPKVQASNIQRSTYQGLLGDWETLTQHQESNHPAIKQQLTEAQQKGRVH